MSLEEALQQQTAAIKALTDAILTRFPGAQPHVAVAVQAPVGVPKAESRPEVKHEPKAAPKPEPEVKAETPAVDTAPAALTYDDLAARVTKVFQADRAKVLGALTKFSVKRATELKPEQYAAFLAEIE